MSCHGGHRLWFAFFRSSQTSLENKPQSSSSSIIKCALRRYYNLFIWHYAALGIDCYSAVSCRPRILHCTLPLLRAHAHMICRPISGKFNGFWFAGFGPNPSYCLCSSPYWAEVDLEWKCPSWDGVNERDVEGGMRSRYPFCLAAMATNWSDSMASYGNWPYLHISKTFKCRGNQLNNQLNRRLLLWISSPAYNLIANQSLDWDEPNAPI